MIDQIFQEADNSIIPKWPPVNNYQIIQDLIDLTSKESEFNYEKQIVSFFQEFKEELLAKIDIIQKKMINETLKYPVDNNQIIQKYQEISKILQFKQLLTNEQSNNIQDYSTQCRNFIQEIESQKDRNTELLQNLLVYSNQLQNTFCLEHPKIIKQQLLAIIDQISFFDQNISQASSNQSNSNIYQVNIDSQNSNKITADLIMKLVSNKSNFCTDQFIIELNLNLQKLNPLLRQLKVNSIFQQNKEPINFSKISEEKLNLVQDYVKHSIKLASDQQYENEIKNQLEIKQINEMINSRTNYQDQEFSQQFLKWSIDIQPFLKQTNLLNCFEKNKFNQFKMFDELTNNQLNKPIQQGDFYQNLKLQGTTFQNGFKDFLVLLNKNNEYIITKQNSAFWSCCISSLNLQKDQKYIFRIRIQSIKEKDEFFIGLMRNSYASGGWEEKMSCELINKKQSLRTTTNYGISNLLKGITRFRINKNTIIELRVSLKDQLLELLDYPNYQFKLGLENQHKSKLLEYEDLRFFLGFKEQSVQICIKEARIVNEFND